MQFILLCNPPKSDASRVCITFLQITQKILTKDIFHWLKLITEILSFLQISSVKKNNHSAFLIFQKICKKTFIHILDLQSILQRIHAATYIHCSFLTLINVFYMFSTIQPSLSLLFSHFVFLFSPSFSYSSRHETRSTFYNFWINFIKTFQLYHGDNENTS